MGRICPLHFFCEGVFAVSRKIINGSYRDYKFLFGNSRTAYSDLTAKKSAAEKNLFILIDDDFPAGYICANLVRDICHVNYAFTVPEKRRRGIFTALLEYLIENNSAVTIRGSTNNGQSKLLIKICPELGFQTFSIFKTARADWKSLCDWKANFFDKFMAERGNRYLEFFSRRGFKIYSVADAPTKYLEQICSREVLADLSFIAVKNDEIAARFLVNAPDKKNLVVEQAFVTQKFLNSGAIFPLLNEFVQAVYVRGCENLAFAVNEDDSSARKFYEKLFGQLKTVNDWVYKFTLQN